MVAKIRVWLGVATACSAAWTLTAAAQEPPPQPPAPLPPLPPSTVAPPAPPPPPSSPVQPQPPTYAPGPPPGYYYVPPPSGDGAPPPIVYFGLPPPPSRVHAPRFSLWLGGRLALFGFAGSFFQNELGFDESTGNFVKAGPEIALDVGARLARRYIPYVTLELVGLPTGRRFAGDSNVHASSSFFGAGFRYIGGDVNTVGLLTDISFGLRSVDLSNDATGESYRMNAFEIFRLGVGAEIRLRTHVTIEPILSFGGGAMSGTSGSITYSPQGSGDGLTHPTYEHGQSIGTQTGYYTISLGVGLHFDLFGR